MARRSISLKDVTAQLRLVEKLKPEVEAWVQQGWSGVTQTTHDLLRYWFERPEEGAENFYPCQRRAIETAIYCHEILQAQTLRELYERLAPEVLHESAYVESELASVPFAKYCLKMATGSGKTWVLAALLTWQYFNALGEEQPGRYSYRFMVVTPGREVLNRILDSFKGRRDPKTGNRDPHTSDYRRDLFMPDSARWRGRFHLEMLEPADIRANASPPDGAFVFLTNWQQFQLRKGKRSQWDAIIEADVEEQPRGEVIAEFMAEFPDLVIMNDEAHHVHGKQTKTKEELVWRRFMKVLYERLTDLHRDNKGLFLQIDYSATPFYGSGKKREYFPHIIYDYPLLDATKEMLVKQLFLEERQSVRGESLVDLDFRAIREKDSKRRVGKVVELSPGQKTLLDIGRRKLEQLTTEFRSKDLGQKPVLMVLCEETEVAEHVLRHFADLRDEKGEAYDDSQVMMIHSDMKDAELQNARDRLEKIDDNDDPLRVVISVLMLREGFDRKNLSVIVVLRATEADLLLEQIVGRGLRLMFPKSDFPQVWSAKEESIEQIRAKKKPLSSFDFLFVVEHPRFRQFYEDLRRQGYLIGEGDTSKTTSTGDLVPVDALPSRIPDYDICWPVQFYDEGKPPDLSEIDPGGLPRYASDFEQLRSMLGKLVIQDRHVESGLRTATWKLDNEYFDFNFFLGRAATAVARKGRDPLLTGKKAELARLIDDYVSEHLFGKHIDFTVKENYTVLNHGPVFDHIVQSVRRAVSAQMDKVRFEVRTGEWRKLSDLPRIFIREKNSAEVTRSIYPRLPFAAVGGGFEKRFMLEILEDSTDVLAFAKLDRKHPLKIAYRDEYGIRRDYEIDFIVKTKECMFLVETKSERDLTSRTVGIKARAAHAWCESATGVSLPPDANQPSVWEYIIVGEGTVKDNPGLSFEAIVPLCRTLRDQIIAKEEARLFR